MGVAQARKGMLHVLYLCLVFRGVWVWQCSGRMRKHKQIEVVRHETKSSKGHHRSHLPAGPGEHSSLFGSPFPSIISSADKISGHFWYWRCHLYLRSAMASPYTYSKLGDMSIRLLRLFPNRDRKAPVRCELFSCPLLDGSVDPGDGLHEALSYVWGSPVNPHRIYAGICPLLSMKLNGLVRARGYGGSYPSRRISTLLWPAFDVLAWTGFSDSTPFASTKAMSRNAVTKLLRWLRSMPQQVACWFARRVRWRRR